MNVTVEIADSLFEEAKACAVRRGVTLRQLIEEGLRATLQRKPHAPFCLRAGSFGGRALKDDLSWPEIRKKVFEGRGE